MLLAVALTLARTPAEKGRAVCIARFTQRPTEGADDCPATAVLACRASTSTRSRAMSMSAGGLAPRRRRNAIGDLRPLVFTRHARALAWRPISAAVSACRRRRLIGVRLCCLLFAVCCTLFVRMPLPSPERNVSSMLQVGDHDTVIRTSTWCAGHPRVLDFEQRTALSGLAMPRTIALPAADT